MSIGVTVFIIAGLIAAIWILIEIKRMKHKLFAIFLIALILFVYFSFTAATNGKEINFKTIEGMKNMGQIYFSWFGSFFSNLKTLTSNVIHMNWKGNSTG
jgi:TRAP-type uncharacterized transport system fused permease subunit